MSQRRLFHRAIATEDRPDARAQLSLGERTGEDGVSAGVQPANDQLRIIAFDSDGQRRARERPERTGVVRGVAFARADDDGGGGLPVQNRRRGPEIADRADAKAAACQLTIEIRSGRICDIHHQDEFGHLNPQLVPHSTVSLNKELALERKNREGKG